MPLAHPILWAAFAAGVILLLIVDLILIGARGQAPTMRIAAVWTAAVVTAAAGFAVAIWLLDGRAAATQFATGYIVEFSLSVDNLLVFMLILDYFAVTPTLRLSALRWGIFGAIVMRGVVIAGGVLLLDRLAWVLYLLGALLIFTGIRMLLRRGKQPVDPARNPMVRAARRSLPVTDGFRDARFVVRQSGRWMVTPLLLVVLAIEWTDLAFAADSIPAIFAITRDPFLVYTSNIFAIVGLRALYFVVEGAMHRFTRLVWGVAVILILVGAKMLLSRWITIPAGTTLLAIVAILIVSLLLSRMAPRATAD